MSVIRIEGIKAKNRTVHGHVHVAQVEMDSSKNIPCYNAEIAKDGSSITLYGSRYGKSYRKTFHLGDKAEYDSYNLSYIGTITKISDKSVTITEDRGRCFHTDKPRVHRLDLHQFAWRNYDFDYQSQVKKNLEEMTYL